MVYLVLVKLVMYCTIQSYFSNGVTLSFPEVPVKPSHKFLALTAQRFRSLHPLSHRAHSQLPWAQQTCQGRSRNASEGHKGSCHCCCRTFRGPTEVQVTGTKEVTWQGTFSELPWSQNFLSRLEGSCCCNPRTHYSPTAVIAAPVEQLPSSS